MTKKRSIIGYILGAVLMCFGTEVFGMNENDDKAFDSFSVFCNRLALGFTSPDKMKESFEVIKEPTAYLLSKSADKALHVIGRVIVRLNSSNYDELVEFCNSDYFGSSEEDTLLSLLSICRQGLNEGMAKDKGVQDVICGLQRRIESSEFFISSGDSSFFHNVAQAVYDFLYKDSDD